MGLVALADVVITVVVAVLSPDVLLLSVPLLLGLTVRSAFAPEGWAPHGLVLTQLGSYAMASTPPRSALDWSVAVLTAVAVFSTHLATSLLAAWPPRAGLPVATMTRWLTAGAVFGLLAVTAGAVGFVAGTTPDTWAPWLVPAGVAALAGLLWVLRVPYLRGLPRG